MASKNKQKAALLPAWCALQVLGWAPRKIPGKSLSNFHTSLSLPVTFSFHLFLFPVGLTSLYLCFRVATAVLWIMWTPHPYSKQRTEAQILAHKHTSISVSNLLSANSR